MASDRKIDELISTIQALADSIDEMVGESSGTSSGGSTRRAGRLGGADIPEGTSPEEIETLRQIKAMHNEILVLKQQEFDLEQAIIQEHNKGAAADLSRIADLMKRKEAIVQNRLEIQTTTKAFENFDAVAEKGIKSLSQGFQSLTKGNIAGIIDGFKNAAGVADIFMSAINADGAIKLEALNSLKAGIESFAIEMFKEFLQAIVDLAFKFENLERNIRKATGASAEFAKDIRGLRNDVIMAGVSAEELAEAHTTLANTFTDYTMMGSQSRQEMLKVTSVLGELGASSADTAQSFQNLTKGLGMTTSAAGQTLIEIEALGKDIGVSASKMASDFNKVSNNVLKLGSKGPQAFKDLAVAAKITGLEIEKITQMTDKFDTFDGAAEQVGKLNAALGGNFVNAMDLMMTTDPTERFNMIRDSILDAGLSFEEMSYHQKQFYADSLGLSSVSDLSKALSGDMDALNGSLGENSAEMEAAEKRAQSLQTFQESLQNLFASFVPVLTPVIDTLQGMAGWLSENGEIIKKVIGFLMFFGGAIATVSTGGFALIPILITLTGGLISFGDSSNKADSFLGKLWKSMSRLKEPLNEIKESFAGTSGFFTEFGEIFGKLFGDFDDKINFTTNLINAFVNYLVRGFTILLSPIRTFIFLLSDSLTLFKNFAKLDFSFESFKIAFFMLGEYISNIFKNIGLMAFDVLTGVFSMPIGLLETLGVIEADTISNFRDKIKPVALTPLATGGIVEGPTPALVGEAGPEAIIPLDKLQTFISPIVNNPVTQMIQQATSGMMQGGPKEITVYLTLDGKVIDKKIVDVMNQKAVDSLRGF